MIRFWPLQSLMLVSLAWAPAAFSAPGDHPHSSPPLLQADGSVLVAEHAYAMPGSFSPEARKAFFDYYARGGDPAISGDITNVRHVYDTAWAGPLLKKWQALYPAAEQRTSMAGVHVDIVTPTAGVALGKRDKVLISLHGGGFVLGNGGIGGRIEAIPMAALGGYKVIAVDYRQAPEAYFPAATDDVEKVYKELLQSYRPEDIGVYGSSAGGMLTAQLVARLQKSGLPRPGAIALLSSGATPPGVSDGTFWALGLTGAMVKLPSSVPKLPSYFTAANMADPAAWPANSPGILARFPPTLVLTGSRDALLGSALDTYAKLRSANVESSLYIREGFGHGYFTQVPDVPEAIAAWQETIKHFDRYLGAPPPQ